MNWYAAHVVLTVEFKDGRQDTLPAWENIYLLHAANGEEAHARAVLRGREEEGDSDGSFEWDGRPARWVFAGVRKVVEVSNSNSSTNEVGDGAELTYQTFELADQGALKALLDGEEVALRLVD